MNKLDYELVANITKYSIFMATQLRNLELLVPINTDVLPLVRDEYYKFNELVANKQIASFY